MPSNLLFGGHTFPGAVEAVAVAIFTLALVVARPRDLSEGISALVGAVLALALGLVSLHQAIAVERDNWNVFLFFLGMMAIASLGDQSGVFDVVAYRAARLARGRVAVLYTTLFLLGAVISILFANDSAALVLTPIVYGLVVRLALDPLPFVFATTFIADTASMVLPVSNPLNVIVSDAYHLGLGAYVGRLWLPSLLVIAINLGVFFVVFRRGIGGRFRRMPVPVQKPATTSSLVILGFLAIAYLAASAGRFPLGIVALGGAATLALNLARVGSLKPRRALREISWPIFGFIGGMFIVVQALANTGVTAQLGAALVRGAGSSHLQTLAVTVVGTAIGSNVINNLPMGLVMVSSVGHLHTSPAVRLDMIYATIAGCDLGPNLTHLGSLATLLWLFFLRRRGLDVSTGDYFKIGVVVTPLMLIGAVLGLWVTGGR